MNAPITPATLRARKKLTLDQVAARMATRKTNVSRYERGELRVTDAYIQRWADAIGVGFRVAYRAYWGAVLNRAREWDREAKEALRRPAHPGIR